MTTINQNKQKLEEITAAGQVAGLKVTFEAKKGRNGMYTLARKFGLANGERPQNSSCAVYVETLEQAAELLTSNDGQDYSIWCYYKQDKVSRRNLYSIESLTFHYSAKGLWGAA